MVKYVIYVDYCIPFDYEYISLDTIQDNAKDICGAIEFAENFIHNSLREVYLVRILEKRGKTIKQNNSVSMSTYEAVLCKRTLWHRYIKENSENYHAVHRYIRTNGDEWFILCDENGEEL